MPHFNHLFPIQHEWATHHSTKWSLPKIRLDDKWQQIKVLRRTATYSKNYLWSIAYLLIYNLTRKTKGNSGSCLTWLKLVLNRNSCLIYHLNKDFSEWVWLVSVLLIWATLALRKRFSNVRIIWNKCDSQSLH